MDMEGVVDGVTSMVQVCDSERNISLFRTGFKKDLYREGHVARILESSDVLKIMHASSIDCQSAYQNGVKLWNLYDTSVAYKVLDYQMHGSSVQIGLNNLCSFCGIPENTMKDRFGDILWKMLITRNGRNGMDSVKTPVLYCAMGPPLPPNRAGTILPTSSCLKYCLKILSKYSTKKRVLKWKLVPVKTQ